MNLKPLSHDLSVTEQVEASDLADLAARGYKSIIGNRPEGEALDQPGWATLEAAAAAQGMAARQIAVVPGAIDNDHVAQFSGALRTLPKPIAAFCRTGMRSTMLWALANPDGLGVDERIRTAAENGYDIEPLRARLAR